MGEETLKKWMQPHEEYCIADGINAVGNKKAKLKFDNSSATISKKKVYLRADVVGKIGRTEAWAVPAGMCLLFIRRRVWRTWYHAV